MRWLLEFSLTNSVLLIATAALNAALAVVLVLRPKATRVLVGVVAAAAGAGVGLTLLWWVADVQDAFQATVSPTTRLWVALGFGGVSLACANLAFSKRRRKALAIVSIPVFVLTAALHVNADVQAYPTLGSVFGEYGIAALRPGTSGPGAVADGIVDYSRWRPPADMPAHGKLGQVEIPGSISKFQAREAVVWLPPAALTKDPPPLPVIIMLSGQPGFPAGSFDLGHLNTVLDKYAATHQGIAPIAVAADQLGDPNNNPMCVDSTTFGNSATYITQDVPNWIRDHYRVSADRRLWAINGYSQGATCATQFTTGYPEIFGSGVATLSELTPTVGSDAQSVAEGFAGSQAAYEAAWPVNLMQQHAPYRDSMLIFGTGLSDARFTSYAQTLHAAAQKAKMQTRLIEIPNSGHSWNTTHDVFEQAFPAVASRMGLDSAAPAH